MVIDSNLPNTAMIAHLWVSHGFRVLPCQPGKKILVGGFGPNLVSLDDSESIDFWFRDRKSNLAVLAPSGAFILDFDDPALYTRFAVDLPELAETYTEKTPRGGSHAFYYSDMGYVPKLVPGRGLEVKRVVVVAPSLIDGLPYVPLNTGRILTVNPLESLAGYVDIQSIAQVEKTSLRASCGHIEASGGIISDVKSRWPILSYLAYFEPKLILTGGGRWRRGLCPWHNDRNPSLWVDTLNNLWGCHACPAHGDVVNWHSKKYCWASQLAAAKDLSRWDVRVEV